ncbi:WXG100 family type VII secretion target [Buchananella hordeovulneris]|uniref:WXG100 family type VII secretion target n=1 Tax=Buchananella hordeovulneris TaxID=52770 RepID=UPI0026DB022F|nr:WXG100 family type VII secretion target [Buchananella hordeovulneris]MDO5080298.1 WXG100 family type VII secretion target [Buchananella hordeovulneris]
MDLRVNYAVLATAAADVATGASNIEAILANMDAELSQLQSNWEGEAQQAYLAAKAQWTEGMEGMREVLARIGRMVESSGETYASVDSTNAQAFM